MMDQIPSLHPFWTVFVAQALQNSKWGFFVSSAAGRVFCHVFFSASILVFPPYSVVSAFWRVASITAQQIPFLLLRRNWASNAGPFGKGYTKISSIAAAYGLWLAARRFQVVAAPTNPMQMGPWPPDRNLLFIVVILSTQVNCVLSLWSTIWQSRGRHRGVEQMVDSMPRRLTWKYHLYLVLLATINALCEEGESRGFWRSEYELAGLSRRDSNLAQALFFGIWHYNGIPSGVAGVCLTFVYGLLMGYLQDASHGLLLPIIAHAVADYYIFANIARRAKQSQRQPASG